MQFPVNNKAIYHTWILVVLWVFELIAELVIIGINGFAVAALGAVLNFVNNASSNGSTSSTCYSSNGNTFCGSIGTTTGVVGAVLAAVAVGLAFGIVFFITHIVQIVQYGRHRLTPKANFAYDCTRFVIWTIIFILNIAGAATGGGYILSVIFAAVVWILYLMSIIYSSILFHRQRRGDYDNILPYSREGTAVQTQTVYPNKQEVNYQVNPQNGPYQQQYQQPYQQQQYRSQ